MSRGWFGPRSAEYRNLQRQRMLGRKITWCDKLSEAHRGQFLPNEAKEMAAVEAAYVGAMLDAEGSVSFKGFCASFTICNTEIELISAILRATGTGGVYYKAAKDHVKEAWTWAAGRRNTLDNLAVQLAPYSLKAQKYIAWRCTNGM